MKDLSLQDLRGLPGSSGEESARYIAAARRERDARRSDNAGAWLELARHKFPENIDVVIEQGWLCQIMEDWPAAAHCWAQVRERAPHHAVGFINGALAARRSQQRELALGLLAEAVQRFPSNAEAAVEYARMAQEGRTQEDAVQIWQAVRCRFTNAILAYLGEAQALRSLGQFASADALLTQAQTRFPDDPRVWTEHCWVAHAARDWSEAARRCEALRARHPNVLVGYTSGALALRELREYALAETLLRQAMERFPEQRAPWLDYAWLASARRDWPEATQRWAAVRQRFPDHSEAYLRGALAYAATWQYEAAEKLLEDGMARFPQDSAMAIEYARLAKEQNIPAEAERRYGFVRDRFPFLPDGHLGCALILRNQFRLSESAALLLEAQAQLPSEPKLVLEYALLPVFAPLRRDRDPEEALRRLRHLTEDFPGYSPAWLEMLRVLRDEGRLVEADEVAAAAIAALPTDSTIAVAYAAIAGARNNWPEARRRYAAVLENHPALPNGRIGLAQALAAMGQTADAEDILREVIRLFPNVQAGYRAHAELAMHREDWNEALVRWTAGHRAFPDDRSFAQRIFDVQLHLAGGEAATSGTNDVAGETTEDPRAELRNLVMKFESLGGRGIGCEFGMFQREFGAEPLGLLRWSDMPYEGIVQVLENRFEGVGLPENTEIFINRENGRPEYCSRDLRGFMFMRAFVYEDEIPIDKMRKQILRRLNFLKGKLIADLEEGEKIFVWRCTERTLSDEELQRLHRAVRSYGDNVLLYVRLQDAAHPNGTVEMQGVGLMVGYMDRFKMAPDGTLQSSPASASWTALCRRAYEVFQSRQGRVEEDRNAA